MLNRSTVLTRSRVPTPPCSTPRFGAKPKRKVEHGAPEFPGEALDHDNDEEEGDLMCSILQRTGDFSN